MNKSLIIITKDAPIPLNASPVRTTCGLLFEIRQAITVLVIRSINPSATHRKNAGDVTVEKYTQTALSELTFCRERESYTGKLTK